MENKEHKFVKNVSEIYHRLQIFQRLTIVGMISNALLASCLLYLILGDPIVILENGAEKLSFIGERREVVITDAEIKKIAEQFIKRRYEWNNFSVPEVIDKLNPIITSGLKDKIMSEMSKQTDSYKAISQYVGKVDVKVDDNGNVVGIFDKILRITGKIKDNANNLPALVENIPLLSEAQVLLKVVRGTVTEENPLGIYINSVVNYESN